MPTTWGAYRLYCYKAGSDDNLSPADDNADTRIWMVPNLLLQKTPADNFTVTTKIRMTAKDQNQYGGIIMMGLDYSALVVRRVGDSFQLQRITCEKADKGGQETVDVLDTLKPTAADAITYHPAIHEDIYMRMVVADGKVDFLYSLDGNDYKSAGRQFMMREGKWIGAKIGLVAVQPSGKEDRGWIEADWLRIHRQ